MLQDDEGAVAGLIAGEALIGLVYAALQFKQDWIPDLSKYVPWGHSYAVGFAVLGTFSFRKLEGGFADAL